MSDVTRLPENTFEIADRGLNIKFDSFDEAEMWVTHQIICQREFIGSLHRQVNELEEQKADAKVELERFRQMARDLMEGL